MEESTTELTYSQKYYSENKERLLFRLSEKTRCECGTVLARVNMAKHRRTAKHENNMRHQKYLEDVKKGLA
uniref:Uncharacterized protein n=1 Tax=viral metagenome TaxID=1070528 RepID=A0A6C0C6Y9_9ZZZZ